MRITRTSLSRGALTALACGVLLVGSGCLVSGSASQKRTGKFVSDATMARIEPGKTTVGWVTATLGEPSSRNKLEDGSEVWRWDYTETRESTAAVFLIFGGSDEKQNDGTVFVEMKDGVVVNKWRA